MQAEVLYIWLMFRNLLGIFGIFDRVARLGENALLVKGFTGAEKIDESRYYKVFENILGNNARSMQYIGPEQDILNRRKDRENLARDFGKAFQAAKIRLGV